jgi:hypothetical protein
MADNTLKTSRTIALIKHESTADPHAIRCFDGYGSALEWAVGHWEAVGLNFDGERFRDLDGVSVDEGRDEDGLIRSVVHSDGDGMTILLLEETD